MPVLADTSKSRPPDKRKSTYIAAGLCLRLRACCQAERLNLIIHLSGQVQSVMDEIGMCGL